MGQSPQKLTDAVQQRLREAEDFSRSADETPPLQTRLPTYAGGLLIVAGLLAVVQGLVVLTSAVTDICFFGVPSAILGFAGIVGGWTAMKRQSFGLAVLGGICAVVGVGFGVGAVLGVSGLILLLLSKSEF